MSETSVPPRRLREYLTVDDYSVRTKDGFKILPKGAYVKLLNPAYLGRELDVQVYSDSEVIIYCNYGICVVPTWLIVSEK
jgi:hypothetical protein